MVGAALVVTSFVLWIINGYMRIHNLAKELEGDVAGPQLGLSAILCVVAVFLAVFSCSCGLVQL
jgi:hypothetical protein